MEGYEASTYGDRFADVYDDWYADLPGTQACIEHLAALATEVGGPVLELGVGSGRLAVPLAERGLEVHGIDASHAMLAQLAARPGGGAVRAVQGDMATLALPGEPRFGLVFVAFSTFFNLDTEAAQLQCLRRVRELLAPGGRFVVEAFVPDSAAHPAGGSVEVRHLGLDEVVLLVSRLDRDGRTLLGQHVQIREDGIRLRPWHLRTVTPGELDELAARAGLSLAHRAGGWRGEPFDAGSTLHVSTYAGR